MTRDGPWVRLSATDEGLSRTHNLLTDPWMVTPSVPPVSVLSRLEEQGAELVTAGLETSTPVPIPDEVHRQLRALGYVAD